MRTVEHIQAVSIADAPVAAAIVRRRAVAFGLGLAASDAVAIAASEMASNMALHAGGGALSVELCDERGVFRLVARDRGPGLERPEELLLEPEAREGKRATAQGLLRKGLGAGGSSLSRLMDEVRVSNRVGGGLEVCATKYRASPEAGRGCVPGSH